MDTTTTKKVAIQKLNFFCYCLSMTIINTTRLIDHHNRYVVLLDTGGVCSLQLCKFEGCFFKEA
jgi:hypothetical protein